MKQSFKTPLCLGIGNILEFYDFAIYGLLIGVISPFFFPADDPATSLIAGLGVFAVGFIARPLGAIFYGYMGDRYGRKKALSFSLLMMASSTVCIGLLPSYEAMGLMAPILLILFRLIQGFSLGGEFSGSLIILSENIKGVENKGSLMSSLVTAAGVSGWFIGAFVCYLCTIDSAPVDFWRVPFLLGALTGWVGYYLRIKTFDAFSTTQTQPHKRKTPIFHYLVEALKHPMSTAVVIGVGAQMGCLFYGLFIFPNSYLPKITDLSVSTSMTLTNIGIGAYMLLLPLMGWFADRIGHCRLMQWATVGTLFSAYFMFDALNTGQVLWILITQILTAILLAAFMGPATFVITQVFERTVRYTGVSLGYNIGSCLFGGLAPVIFSILIEGTGLMTAPTIYIIVCAGMGLLATRLSSRILSEPENFLPKECLQIPQDMNNPLVVEKISKLPL